MKNAGMVYAQVDKKTVARKRNGFLSNYRTGRWRFFI